MAAETADEGADRDPPALCLGTTELLEAILLHLDTRTLLLSQRVSSHFRAVIAASRGCQQRLFLQPATPTEILAPDFRPNQLARPFIFVDEVQDVEVAEVGSGEIARMPDSQYTQRAILNPLLFDLPKWRLENPWPAQLRFTRALGLTRPGGQLPEAGSLRKMYLAHPMPALLRVKVPSRWGEEKFKRYIVRGRDFLRPRTLGELMDEFDAEVEFDPGHGWSGVVMQLTGRRLPEPVKEENRRAVRRRENQKRRADEREREGVGRDGQWSVEEAEHGVWPLFEGDWVLTSE